MRILQCFLLLFLLFFCFSAKSDVGCQVPDGRVFYGVLNPAFYRSSCPGIVGDFGPYASVTGPAAGLRTCVVVFAGNSLTGNRVNYTVLNCPLDDYIPLVLLAAGGFGFYFLRKEDLRFG